MYRVAPNIWFFKHVFGMKISYLFTWVIKHDLQRPQENFSGQLFHLGFKGGKLFWYYIELKTSD